MNKFTAMSIRFKRCPRCGEAELEKTRDGYLYCPECDYEEYDG